MQDTFAMAALVRNVDRPKEAGSERCICAPIHDRSYVKVCACASTDSRVKTKSRRRILS